MHLIKSTSPSIIRSILVYFPNSHQIGENLVKKSHVTGTIAPVQEGQEVDLCRGCVFRTPTPVLLLRRLCAGDDLLLFRCNGSHILSAHTFNLAEWYGGRVNAIVHVHERACGCAGERACALA